MRRINKILIFSFLISLCFFNFSIATDDSDCGKFAVHSYTQKSKNGFQIITQSWDTDTNIYSNFLTTEQQTAIIDNASLNTAMLNLKKYCCENELGGLTQQDETCTKDSAFFNDNALDSPYLFDHLFDVFMRRLSGLTGEKNIYEQTNMTTDEKGAERRARITEKAEGTGGATPQVIIDHYVETRKKTPSNDISSKLYEIFGNRDNGPIQFLTYVSGKGGSKESIDVANAIKNYSERTIYDRYINACAMTEYFYLLLLPTNDSKQMTDDQRKTVNRVTNGTCHSTVTNQINAENSYVKLVIQQSSNLLFLNYIQGYLDYLRGRSDNLRSKQTTIKNEFLDIVRAVPRLVKQCVH